MEVEQLKRLKWAKSALKRKSPLSAAQAHFLGFYFVTY